MDDIKNQIHNLMINSLKNKCKEEKSVYELAYDAIIKEEKNKLKDLSDDEIIIILKKEIKQYEETKDYAEKVNNYDLIQKSNLGINLLSKFVPVQMSEIEIETFILNNFNKEDLIKKNISKIMKECSSLKNKADMKIVSDIVKKLTV